MQNQAKEIQNNIDDLLNHTDSFINISRSDATDHIGNIFIDITNEVDSLSNDFCKYYAAHDKENQTKYYAIIYDKTFLPDVQSIDLLSKHRINNLINVVDYSIVYISQEQRYALVVIIDHYDPTEILANYLKQSKGTRLSTKACEGLIRDVTNIIVELEKHQIFGCSINTQNIIVRNGSFYAMREFINTYPHFIKKTNILHMK